MAKTNKAPNVAPNNAKSNPPKENPVKPIPTQVIHVFSPIAVVILILIFSVTWSNAMYGKLINWGWIVV